MLLEQVIVPQLNKLIQSFSSTDNVWCILKAQLLTDPGICLQIT